MRRFPEIGERLRAYRLGLGLDVGELAARLGVSRATVYRYEDGEVVKIETLARLSQVLNVSMPSLLGVGVEYVSSAVAYFERLRQLEEKSERIATLFGRLAYVLTSDEYDTMLCEALLDYIPQDVDDRPKAREEVESVMEILRRRKEAYRQRRPAVVSIISTPEIEQFLAGGLTVPTRPNPGMLAVRRRRARREIEHIAALMECQPISVQIGVVLEALPTTGFHILRQPDRSVVAISSFRLGYQPNIRVGIAMITSDAAALAQHTQVMEDLWTRAAKGMDGARVLREILQRR